MDALFAIILVAVLIFAVYAFASSSHKFISTASSRKSYPLVVKKTQPSRMSNDSGSLDSLMGLVVIGIMGFAAYKFIQSGGLEKLREEIGKLPVKVNGQYKDIASAIKEDSYIEMLLRDALQLKLKEVYERDHGFQSLNQNTPRAASDVARTLRDALESRMRREGI